MPRNLIKKQRNEDADTGAGYLPRKSLATEISSIVASEVLPILATNNSKTQELAAHLSVFELTSADPGDVSQRFATSPMRGALHVSHAHGLQPDGHASTPTHGHHGLPGHGNSAAPHANAQQPHHLHQQPQSHAGSHGTTHAAHAPNSPVTAARARQKDKKYVSAEGKLTCY